MNTDTLVVERMVGPIITQGTGVVSFSGGAATAEASSFTDVISHAFIDASPSTSDRVGAALYSFAKRLRGIRDVRAVAYAHERGIQLVWTFIERRDKPLRRRIYEAERRLMDEFPELTLDFNVVSLDQHHGGPLLADDVRGSIVFYRQG